jgi:hypothetical protein
MFTDQQAGRESEAVLGEDRRDGEARIRTRDGQEFSVRPVLPARSPLGIPGVDLHLSADEIVQAIREGRER